MKITTRDFEYIEKRKIPELERQLESLRKAVIEADEHGDRSENAEFELAKGEFDATQKQLNYWRNLLTYPVTSPSSRRITTGSKVRITPVSPNYGDSLFMFEKGEYTFRDYPDRIKNEFIISEVITDMNIGFISKDAEIIKQVFDQPSGVYEIKTEHYKSQEYRYDVL